MRFQKLIFLIILVLGGLLSSTLAQAPTLSGGLADIRVEGTSDSTIVTLIKTVIRSREGTDVSLINLESERNLVLSVGVFSEVTVRLEDQPDGPVMSIVVKENPRISSVNVEGSTIAPDAQWRQALARQLIEAGRLLDTQRAEEAIVSIQQTYRQAGFPFDVDVTLNIDEDTETEGQDEETASLTYAIIETREFEELVFEGNTVFDEAALRDAFLPLTENKNLEVEAETEVLEI